MKSILLRGKALFKEAVVLFRSLPPALLAFFALSVIGMNLLANKSINTGLDWLALDCGVILSWASFLCMDIIVKRYGVRASIFSSAFALLANLFFALIFFLGTLIPGQWGESFVEGSEAVINGALDRTFAGNWYIVMGSSVAFMASAIANALLNAAVGVAFKKKPDSFIAFACRAYVSTTIAQFIDNILFALIVSHVLFGWNMVQCVTCAATGALAELLMEIFFSPLGYRVCRHLEKNKIGQAYIDYRNELEAAK